MCKYMKKNSLTITKNKTKKIERQMQIKIFDSQHEIFTQLCLSNLFIKINFLFNQMIIETDTNKKLIK